MLLTQQNAAAYIGQQLDSNRRFLHYYPLTVFQYNGRGPFYVKDRNGVCCIVPDEKDHSNPIRFDFVVAANGKDNRRSGKICS